MGHRERGLAMKIWMSFASNALMVADFDPSIPKSAAGRVTTLSLPDAHRFLLQSF